MWIKHKPEWLTPAPLKLAAICGHLEIVKRLMNASKAVWTPEAMDLAAMNGHLDVVKYLHGIENGPGCTTAAMDGAATYGHLEVVVFLNENRGEGCTSRALQGAVYKGYAKVVEYLLNHRNERYAPQMMFYPQYYRMYCHQAVEEKDYIGVLRCLYRGGVHNIDDDFIMLSMREAPLATLEFVLEHNIFGITERILKTAIEIGDKDTIRYALTTVLTENNKPISLLEMDNDIIDLWTPIDNPGFISRSGFAARRWGGSTALDTAAALGDLDTVILLHRTRIKCCTVDAMNKAAAIGRLDIVEWLHTHRTEGCTHEAMTNAVAGGHFEVVRWLHEVRGLNCTKNGLSTAAYNGDIEMVNYLIGIPEITNVQEYTNYGGVFTMYLPGNGPRIKVSCALAVNQAASNGHINIVQILHDYAATTDAMDGAACNGHLDMVKYLHMHRTEGCTAKAYIDAVKTNRFDILEYLVTNNCCRGVVDFEPLCIDAAAHNNLLMLDFCINQLNSHFTPKVKQSMMYKAAVCGQLDVVTWLYEVKGFGWTSVIQDEAERRGHKGITRYLKSVGNCEGNVLDNSSLRALQ